MGSDKMSRDPEQSAREILLQELLQERRSRREPEHSLVAAYIAFAGGAMWGVAALKAIKAEGNLSMYVAAGVCMLVACIVIKKILHVGESYDEVICELQELGPLVLGSTQTRLRYLRPPEKKAATNCLEREWLEGRVVSCGVVITTAIAAVVFCVVLALDQPGEEIKNSSRDFESTTATR
jgi:hypothetical protein